MHRPATTTQIRLIIGFTALYLATSTISAWINGNGEFVFYIVVMLILMGTVAWVHHQVGFSAGLLGGLCGWGLLHMAGGLVPIPPSWHTELDQGVLYNLWFIPQRLKYDQVVHAFGFGFTTWLCWQCLSVAFHSRSGTTLSPTLGLMVLCAAGGMGFGALNEVVEFFATLLLPSTNVGGYVNTGWDLVANLVGCITAAFVIFFQGRSRL